MKLTELAHNAIRRILRPCDIAIDGTAGNGHDTCFLAECVGPAGKVYTFDIQAVAIERTANLLKEHGIDFRSPASTSEVENERTSEVEAGLRKSNRVVLHQRSHAELSEAIPPEYHGKVAAAMFNFGYLPGGDHSICTETASSIAAVTQAAELLRIGGILSLLLYPGHPGGDVETEAVESTLRGWEGFEWASHVGEKPGSPRLWLGLKTADFRSRSWTSQVFSLLNSANCDYSAPHR